MKKSLSVITVALLAVVMLFSVSCKKDAEKNSSKQQYAKAVAGQFTPKDGDVTLKAAPTVGGHQYNCYDQKTTGAPWTVVDGTEFLPGSAAATNWGRVPYAINGQPWWLPGGTNSCYVTYCPILPMRVVVKATKEGFGTPYTYMGIWEGTPNGPGFSVQVQDRRLGDVLTLNTDALTALPGYTSMSFEVVYTKYTIDIAQTEATSPVTTNAWPVYVYSSSSEATTTLDDTKSLTNRTVYDGPDAKISGTITIKIHVDGIIITKTTQAPGMGFGLAITLSTNRVGWYDSGTIGITENDITLSTVDIPVN